MIAPVRVAVVPEFRVRLPEPKAVVIVPAAELVKAPPAAIRIDPVPLLIKGALIAIDPLPALEKLTLPCVIVTGPPKVEIEPAADVVEKLNVFPIAS